MKNLLTILMILTFLTASQVFALEYNTETLVCEMREGSHARGVSCVSKASIEAAKTQTKLNELQIKIAEKELARLEREEEKLKKDTESRVIKHIKARKF